MNTYRIIFILSFYSHVSISQNNVKSYYEYINKAELNIVEGRLHKALVNYKSAFKLNPPFTYDLHNSILLCQEIDSIQNAIQFSKILLQRGAKIAFFNQFRFTKLIKNKIWLDSLKKFELNNHLVTIDTTMRNMLDSMMTIDQKFRINSHQDSMVYYDSLLLKKIITLFNDKGFPSEDKCGIWLRNDTTLSFTHPIDILLRHQVKNGHKFLRKTLEHFVKLGVMHPLKFVELSVWFDDPNLKFGCSDMNQTVFLQINDSLFTCNDSHTKEININRSNYFLEPIEDLKKKILFFYYNDRRYKLNISLSNSYLQTQEQRTIDYYLNFGLKLEKKLKNNDPYFK